MRLPAPRSEREHMRASPDSRADGPKVMRIMITDDHEISRAALRALLRTEGVNVIADLRTDGDVLAAARALRPDVAVVDVTPATGTGLAIARGLRALPTPPIVILTSSTDRAQFGPRINGYLFIAKADLSATAIASLASAPDCANRTPGALTRPRRATTPPVGPRASYEEGSSDNELLRF